MNWRDNYFFGKYKEGCSRYFVLKEDNSGWDIVSVGSLEWNSIDQQMWKGHDIDESYGVGCSQRYAPDWLPPIPTLEEMLAVKSFKWKDNFKGKVIYLSKDMPYLKEYFDENSIEEKKLYFALVEDLYESSCGDGIYRYAKKVSFNREEIVDFIKLLPPNREEGNSFHYGSEGYLVEHTICFNGDNFIMPDFAPQTFEHYKLDDLMQIAEDLANPDQIKYFVLKKDKNKVFVLKSNGELYERFKKVDIYGYDWILCKTELPDAESYFSYSKYEYEKMNYGSKFEE